MDRFVAFVCNFLCAAALFGSSGNLDPETQEEDRGAAQGVVVQNKAPSVIGCPVARYPVRFGRDYDANLIDLSAFTRTTVEEMRSWPAPSIIPPANRISPYETTVLALEATLIEYRQERSLDGSDYRLVLADESGRTIIAKISSPDCAAQDSGEPGSELPDSRFLAGIAVPPGPSSLPGFRRRQQWSARAFPSAVLGIGMFDSPSGQAGEAPNGIQLCPVLDISFDEERMPVVHAPVPHHPHGGGVRR